MTYLEASPNKAMKLTGASRRPLGRRGPGPLVASHGAMTQAEMRNALAVAQIGK